MEHGRDKSLSNAISSIQDRVNHICDDFKDFTDGFRVLMLLQRNKDGGSNEEEKRIFESYVTTSPGEFKRKLFNLMLIKSTSKIPLRIYVNLNPRNPFKVIRYIEHALLDAHYSDEEGRESVYKKLLKNQRHYLMQQENRDSSLFIIDVDDVDGKDAMGEALAEMEKIKVQEIKRYRTKNGWHIIVKPFNLSLWKGPGEIKKDALILLDY